LKLFIKNMVSHRCKLAVKSELENIGLPYAKIEMGEVELNIPATAEKLAQLKTGLLQIGLELLDDTRLILVEKIKNAIIEMVHYSDEWPKVNFSEHLSNRLNRDYTYLANVFSEITGNTIERFIIANKLERVKELLAYDEHNITEIAYRLHYSSVAHLSNQFKKETGLTPTEYKNLKIKNRIELQNL